jgi:hypothetical protein
VGQRTRAINTTTLITLVSGLLLLSITACDRHQAQGIDTVPQQLLGKWDVNKAAFQNSGSDSYTIFDEKKVEAIEFSANVTEVSHKSDTESYINTSWVDEAAGEGSTVFFVKIGNPNEIRLDHKISLTRCGTPENRFEGNS